MLSKSARRFLSMQLLYLFLTVCYLMHGRLFARDFLANWLGLSVCLGFPSKLAPMLLCFLQWIPWKTLAACLPGNPCRTGLGCLFNPDSLANWAGLPVSYRFSGELTRGGSLLGDSLANWLGLPVVCQGFPDKPNQDPPPSPLCVVRESLANLILARALPGEL